MSILLLRNEMFRAVVSVIQSSVEGKGAIMFFHFTTKMKR